MHATLIYELKYLYHVNNTFWLFLHGRPCMGEEVE